MDRKHRMRPVMIDWDDACSTMHGWAPKEHYTETAGLLGVRTIGFLLSKDKDTVTVVQSYEDFGKVDAAISIPRVGITKMRYLTRGN